MRKYDFINVHFYNMVEYYNSNCINNYIKFDETCIAFCYNSSSENLPIEIHINEKYSEWFSLDEINNIGFIKYLKEASYDFNLFDYEKIELFIIFLKMFIEKNNIK